MSSSEKSATTTVRLLDFERAALEPDNPLLRDVHFAMLFGEPPPTSDEEPALKPEWQASDDDKGGGE